MSIGTQLRSAVMVRIADPMVEPVIDWCQANSDRNAFDRGVLDYPSTKVLAAYQDKDNGSVINYMPVQGAAVLESIGPNPEVTPLELANGVMESVKHAAFLAHMCGFREVYFVASDETTALGAEKMGFEPLGRKVKEVDEETSEVIEVFIPFKVYRKKL